MALVEQPCESTKNHWIISGEFYMWIVSQFQKEHQVAFQDQETSSYLHFSCWDPILSASSPNLEVRDLQGCPFSSFWIRDHSLKWNLTFLSMSWPKQWRTERSSPHTRAHSIPEFFVYYIEEFWILRRLHCFVLSPLPHPSFEIPNHFDIVWPSQSSLLGW